MKIQCIDLFCGGGGFSHGFIQGGGTIVLAVDNWEKALEFHKLNHPDIETLKYELGGNIEEFARILEGYIDRRFHFHLHGSPPCQELSSASKHKSIDGYLMVKWFLRLVEYMKPNSWSMENVLPVSHFLDKDSIPYIKLNSANFGVPQTRKRVFAGQGFTVKETHPKERWVSIIEALPHLEGELLRPCKSMKERWSNLSLNNQFPTITSQSPNQIQIVSSEQIYLNTQGFTISNSIRSTLPDEILTNPSKTICHLTPVLRTKIKENFERIRSLTIDETLILQGWHNAKIPKMNKNDLFKIVGNMVCPPVSKAICKGIILNHEIDFEKTFSNYKFEQINLFGVYLNE